MNIIMMQGRVPFQPNFFEANGDKKACATLMLAVNTGIKDEETGYYKENNFKCTAFGGWAESLNKNWNNKLIIDVVGELTIGRDYEKDGEIVKGQPEIRVKEIHEYNTLDKTIIRAKIPNFENAITYKAAEGDKKSFARIKLSISTGVKDEETGYYKERIISAKAFGGTADFLNNYYKSGDFITLDGKYQDGQDYEKDGEVVKAMPELLISNIYGFPRKKDYAEGGKTGTKKATASSKPTVKAPGKPAAAPGKAPGKPVSKLGAPGKKLGLKK